VIISNGGGPAVMATDALIAGGGELAELSRPTLAALDALLPPDWSHGNPVDIVFDAPASRYAQALHGALSDPAVDAALLVHAPNAIVPAAEVARVSADAIAQSGRPVLTCWMGGEAVREAREILARDGIPTYSTPEEAVGAFIHAVRFNSNQRQLMEVPSSIPDSFVPRVEEAKAVVSAALAKGRTLLTDLEARQVLAAYCIPVEPAVPPTARRPFAHELIAGITVDPTFGPVILFGKGGAQVEVAPDNAIGFPPLNMALAAELISRTRVRRLLAGFRNVPAVNMRSLQLALVQVSQLAVDIAEIVELEINPLLVDDRGVIALDARIRVAPARGAAADRLAIRPYPKELEEEVVFDGRTVLLRPLRPEDEPQHREFVSHISEEDMQSRFFHAVKVLPSGDLAYLTQLDYERAMAFIAVAMGEGGKSETIGVVRAQADPDNECAEFAVIVRSDLKGHGLGSLLMEKIIRYCRQRGVRRICWDVIATNTRMQQLAAAQGFHAETAREGVVRVTLEL
jgi:acetyltransferase